MFCCENCAKGSKVSAERTGGKYELASILRSGNKSNVWRVRFDSDGAEVGRHEQRLQKLKFTGKGLASGSAVVAMRQRCQYLPATIVRRGAKPGVWLVQFDDGVTAGRTTDKIKPLTMAVALSPSKSNAPANVQQRGGFLGESEAMASPPAPASPAPFHTVGSGTPGHQQFDNLDHQVSELLSRGGGYLHIKTEVQASLGRELSETEKNRITRLSEEYYHKRAQTQSQARPQPLASPSPALQPQLSHLQTQAQAQAQAQNPTAAFGRVMEAVRR
jgi:hypothetical protein